MRSKLTQAKSELRLALIPAPHDSAGFWDVNQAFQAQGIPAIGEWNSYDQSGPEVLSGTFVLAVTALTPFVTGIAGILGAWLHAKYGRRVRLKVGDIEAEAQTAKEVEKLLEKAQEIQRKNEPRKIHEP